MKKLLIVHNRYQNIGGEDIAVENEIRFLKKYFEIEALYFDNHINSYLSELKSLFFSNNKDSTNKLKQKLKSFNPDVVYVHNTWFKASLGIFNFLEKEKFDVMIKIHNFRYFCTRTMSSKKHIQNDKVCLACGYKPRKYSYFNKYFKESFLKSFFVLMYGKKYFKILKNPRIKLILLTKFHQNFINNIGNFESQIFHFPNPMNIPEKIDEDKENYIFYGGRISEEKGVDKLIQSFLDSNLIDTKLKIAGDGPQLSNLKNQYSNFQNIEFLGLKTNQEVLNIIKKSTAVVTATKLYEGQPTLLCEASLLGVPSVFPLTGGIEEYFPKNYKLSFEQFNYEDLAKKLTLIENHDFITQIGEDNKKFITEYLNEEKLINNFYEIIDA
tara:strand:+ start:408 stop:1556 length:1149 start_codon:yes stop_codon:yes gene_type:complete